MSEDDHRRTGPEGQRAPAAGRPFAAAPARWLAACALVGVYGWWAVGLPSFSATATLAVVLAGLAAVALGMCRRRPVTPRRPVTTAAPWAVLAAVAAVWQLAAYLQHPRDDHPTLSSLTNAALGSQVARTAAFVAWLLTAWALARR
jgi:fucose 4-O-acetylase-like acetyltransferase